MSILYIVQDFSLTSSHLFETFSANSVTLAKNNIEIAPLNPQSAGPVRDHAHLWKDAEQSGFVGKTWSKIASDLDAGKNSLVFNTSTPKEKHEYFWSGLDNNIDLIKHDVRAIFVMGRPGFFLEMPFRDNPDWRVADYHEYISWYIPVLLALPDMISFVKQTYGRNSFSVILNPQETPVPKVDAAVFKEVFSLLGCSVPRPEPIPAFWWTFASAATWRLMSASEARYNAWPVIDQSRFVGALSRIDSTFPVDYFSPLDLRQDYADREKEPIRKLAAMLDVPVESLSVPEAFATQAQAVQNEPLMPELASSFVHLLDNGTRDVLRQRLVNDRQLLTADQKVLLSALEPGEFTEIGGVESQPELTVLTMTYNHEKYIAECMDSVLAQKTDFQVRHVVLDHCSTDGTAEIVAEYAKKYPSIRPVLLSQHVAHENVSGLFLRCQSRYAALCDGDDYFTEPTKLQKQVDMLEASPHLALCFHPVAAVFEDGSQPPMIFPPLQNLPKRSKKEFYLADLMNSNIIQTNSVVYRWRFRDGLPEWFRPDLCPGDWYWHMLHAETGKIGFIPEVMSVYRRHSGALYADTFNFPLELRRKHGLVELETYKACNDHFNGRYFRSLSRLANNVFASFLQLAHEEDNTELFDQAVNQYPEFARVFLAALKNEKKEKGF